MIEDVFQIWQTPKTARTIWGNLSEVGIGAQRNLLFFVKLRFIIDSHLSLYKKNTECRFHKERLIL